MKNNLKNITKDKLAQLKIKDQLFTEKVVSLDDKRNKKYLDNLSYQQYLANLRKK